MGKRAAAQAVEPTSPHAGLDQQLGYPRQVVVIMFGHEERMIHHAHRHAQPGMGRGVHQCRILDGLEPVDQHTSLHTPQSAYPGFIPGSRVHPSVVRQQSAVPACVPRAFSPAPIRHRI